MSHRHIEPIDPTREDPPNTEEQESLKLDEEEHLGRFSSSLCLVLCQG